MGGIAAGFAIVVFGATAALPLASMVAADREVQTEALGFAQSRPIPDPDLGRAIPSSTRRGTKGWIALHRPDGEVVYIKVDQIVFVMSAKNTGASERARSMIQLLNGHSDVRESVEEVMQAVENNVSIAKDGT